VYLTMGYLEGKWPPGEKSIKKYLRGAKNMIGAHIAAYKTIHAVRKQNGFSDTIVGTAHHVRVMEPYNGSLAARPARAAFDRIFHDLFIRGMADGTVLLPAGSGSPFGRGKFQDFLGLNYYTRDLIRFDLKKPGDLFGDRVTGQNAEHNDLGWEIYPDGIRKVCEKYYKKYKTPIFITENGTCDRDDRFRPRYIYDHLLKIRGLIDSGIDVRRYYHWTLMDNFEWAEGLSARFGLVEVDFTSQERKIRKSGYFYRDICENNAVTEEMIRMYL